MGKARLRDHTHSMKDVVKLLLQLLLYPVVILIFCVKTVAFMCSINDCSVETMTTDINLVSDGINRLCYSGVLQQDK